MKAWVIDASFAGAVVLYDEKDGSAADFARQVIGESGFIAPSLWIYETANILKNVVRRGRLDASRRDDVIAGLEILSVTLYSPPGLSYLLSLAQEYRLSAYDAAYIELAVRTGAGLATRDNELNRAAHRAGLECVPLPSR